MNPFTTALKMFVYMTLLTGVVYPIVITVVAQLTMSNKANGTLLKNGEQTVGSLLIAQHTTDDRYFWPRPSAIDYDPMKPSGGSNLGPTSQKLKETVAERQKKLGEHAPSELLYASGSGLDPHISLETAYFQLPRVAKARSMEEKDLRAKVDALAEGHQWGLFGPRYINVLLLNHELDTRR